jgi:diadenosine tetraphosphate (Ap4A) HIT family hydrolase
VLRSRRLIPAVTFVLGIAVGGWLFSQSQPRSFLAVGECERCYNANDLAGLLASAGIQRAGNALPFVVKETERCIAIEHPFRKVRYHYIVFPKKDVKSIADISLADHQYVLECMAVMRTLVLEHGLRRYRVVTNGPGLQHVTYLHFHVVADPATPVPSRVADPAQ